MTTRARLGARSRGDDGSEDQGYSDVDDDGRGGRSPRGGASGSGIVHASYGRTGQYYSSHRQATGGYEYGIRTDYRSPGARTG